MKLKSGYAALTCLCVAGSLVLFAMSLLRGELNQDEGWYLYGARLVAEGELPYVDFATTQGPVMPFAYAAAYPIIEALGVAGGRLVTAALGGLCVLVGCWLAVRLLRLAEPHAGAEACAACLLIVLGLLALNPFQVYFMTVVKTYALAALLLVLSFVCLTFVSGRRGNSAALGAGALAMLSAGTRASAAFVIPVTLVVLFLESRRLPAGERSKLRNAWIWYGAGVAVVFALIFLPFIVLAPEGVWFAMVEYHSGREVGSLWKSLAYKGGFVSRCILDYPLALGGALAMLIFTCRTKALAASAGHYIPRVLWISVLCVSLVHMLAPFPYDDYQALIYPLLCSGLSAWVVRLISARFGPGIHFKFCTAVVGVSLLFALSSPVIHSWFLGERDRIWWPLRAQPPLKVLQETANVIKAQYPEVADASGGILLTQDPYLAVETGLRLPRGFELGQFCYFPDWETGYAQRRHVMNRELMEAALRATSANCAAFSGYGLSIRSPEVLPLDPAHSEELWEIVNESYKELAVVDPFGQADTRLRILVRR